MRRLLPARHRWCRAAGVARLALSEHNALPATGGVVMKAAVGDRIRTPGRHVGDAVRVGEVIAVRGADGDPPYLVRWDDGHEGVCAPGPETKVERAPLE
jgi:hypothetical protein